LQKQQGTKLITWIREGVEGACHAEVDVNNNCIWPQFLQQTLLLQFLWGEKLMRLINSTRSTEVLSALGTSNTFKKPHQNKKNKNLHRRCVSHELQYVTAHVH
jgi:hypothetical protein